MKSNTNEFIKKAVSVHGKKYNYSEVNYENSSTKVIILCSYHGAFKQTPNDHLSGRGCRECKRETLAKIKSSNSSDFIKKARKIHGKQYDYSKVNYKGSHDKITIICNIHGEFSQTATDHLVGRGCRECGIQKAANNRRLTKEEFIKRAKKVHGNKYNYHKSLYKTMHEKIIITCKKHGDFKQTPLNHIFDENGCPKCKESKGEKKIRKYLDSKNLIYKPQHRVHTCKNKKPLPFDFMVEFKSQKFFIEFQGQQHFYKATGMWKGTQEQLDNIQKRDKIKKEWCLKQDIPLLIITYKEYDLIEKKISDFLGL